MLEVELGNVTEAIANLTERGAVDPVVKATLTLSESGFISVTDAVAYGEIKDESLTGNNLIYIGPRLISDIIFFFQVN
jgi:hypoxia up-regulated 1